VKESGHLARNIAASFTPSPPIVKKKAEQENQNKSCSINISELVDTAIKQLSSSFLDGSENATKSQNILLKYREHEYAQIQNFLQSSFQTNELKGSLYISGAPGCGKTALLRSAQGNILDLWKTQGHDEDDLQLIHLNAMALKDSNRLFGTLASTISGRKEFLASEMKNAFQFLEQAILFGCANEGQRNKTVLLVLDEMDIFLNKNTYCQDLYRLFQLAHKRPTTGKSTTSLILVGIANSVDLTERHLPHLRLHLGCTPKVIIFKAYSFQTIEKILIDRLGGLQVYTKLVSSHGVSFLARKLASTTGDIRTALDVTRRILQQRRGSHQGTKWEPVPLAEMVKSIKTSLEAKGSQTIQSLPRNLQMILFACIQLVQASSYFGGLANEVYPLDDLYRAYCDLTREAGIYQPLNCRDFRQALEVLSSEGLLEAQELKKNELIKLLFRPSEVVQMFRQDPFFARFSY
jgi:Cdc6-like AAA superfamily ATPase